MEHIEWVKDEHGVSYAYFRSMYYGNIMFRMFLIDGEYHIQRRNENKRNGNVWYSFEKCYKTLKSALKYMEKRGAVTE